MRRLVTRLLAMIPSMAVALTANRQGIDTLLVASQVVLSIVLPFVTFPLLYCTSNKSIMSVRKTGRHNINASDDIDEVSAATYSRSPAMVENADVDDIVDFSNSALSTCVGAGIWLGIVAANIYVIIELVRGTA